MMAWPSGSPAFALAWRLGLVAIAAFALWQVMTMPIADPLSGASPAPLPAQAVEGQEQPPAAPTSNTYPAILARPLFYPSRLPWSPPPPPPAPEPEPVVQAPPALDGYAFVGAVVSGDNRTALVRPVNENRTVLLSQGQEFEGWTLTEITQEKLRFTAGSAEYEMIFPRHSDLGQ